MVLACKAGASWVRLDRKVPGARECALTCGGLVLVIVCSHGITS